MKKIKLPSKLLLSILLASVTAPIYGTELYDEKKVSHIEIVVDTPEGAVVDPRPIMARLKTKEGDSFSQQTFDSDLKNLSETYDRIDPSIKLDNGEVSIVIKVSPRPVVSEVIFSGNDQIKTATLQKELDIQPNSVFNRQSFNKSFTKLKEYYFKKGYFESQLSYTVEKAPNSNTVTIKIEVLEGRPGHIQKIILNGFTDEEKSDIEEQMYLKKYNFLTSWMTGTGTYRDELLEQDKLSILNYLHNKGYADAKVTIQLTEDPKNGKLIVEITAHRGQLFHFGSIHFAGNSLISTEELAKRSLITDGAPFSPDKVRETVQALKEYYGQKGYIDASIQHETILKENEPVFDVDFYIDEGDEYKVGLVHIFGNTSTKSNVILRESLLVPGETFDARKLKATQSKLEAMGYFKNVNVYAVRSADDSELGTNYRDVYIEVEETTTGNVSLFMGFSSTDSIFGGIDLTERNFNIAGLPKALVGKIADLRGGGEYFHVKGTVGKEQNNVLVSWMNPYVFDSLWRFGVEISRTWSQLQRHAKVVTYGGSVYTNYPLSKYWTAGLRERLRHAKDNLSLHPLGNSPQAIASAEITRKQLDQNGLISAFSANISYDSVDNLYKPRKGWRSYGEAEVSGIGGNYYFGKLSYTNSIYWPVWKKGTLKFRADFKTIVPYGKTNKSTVPYSERLFLGGEGTVRGYQPFSIGPMVELLNDQGVYENTSTPYGGLTSTLLSVEYNQEIFKMLDIFTFVDVGSVEKDYFKISQLRPTTGVGVRLDIGNGTPIMVGYGIPLVEKDRKKQNGYSKWQKVFFSMGGRF